MADQSDPETPNWRHQHLWQFQPVRDGLLIAAIFGLLYLGKLLSPVTVPIMLALTLAYLFEPVVARVTKSGRISRRFAAVAIIVATVLAITVPIAVGGAFAVVQGLNFADRVAFNIEQARTVVEAYSPAALRESDPGIEGAPRGNAQEDESDAGGESTSESRRGFLERLDADLTAFDSWITQEAPEDVQSAYSSLTGSAWRWTTRHAAAVLPDQSLEKALAWASNNLGMLLALGAETGSGAALTAGSIVRRVASMFVLMFGAFLTAFFFFFMSTNYARVMAYFANLIPDRNRDLTLDLIGKMDRVVAGFIRGRLTIAVIQSIIFALAYFLAGVPAALLLGALVGFLSVVPYLAMIGVPVSILMIWLDPPSGFRGEWWWITLAPMGIYFGIQALDDYIWTPMIQGKQTGLDTPTVLFASIAGGILAGIYGLLLAIPVAACLKILLQEIFWPRFHAWAEGEAVDPLPFGKQARTDDHHE